MPNGKAGDGWYTDIVLHDLPTFSPEADRLITQFAATTHEAGPEELLTLVDTFLDSVGYEELVSRGTRVGMEYRNLRPDERSALEVFSAALASRCLPPTDRPSVAPSVPE